MASEQSLKTQGLWDYYNDCPRMVAENGGMRMSTEQQLQQAGRDLGGIHPAPSEFTDAQIAVDPILHFFHYAHLPEKLRATSRLFFILASTLVTQLPRNAERTVALRKLLEAKDAAVRANLPAPTFKPRGFTGEPELDEPVEVGGHDEDRSGPVNFND